MSKKLVKSVKSVKSVDNQSHIVTVFTATTDVKGKTPIREATGLTDYTRLRQMIENRLNKIRTQQGLYNKGKVFAWSDAHHDLDDAAFTKIFDEKFFYNFGFSDAGDLLHRVEKVSEPETFLSIVNEGNSYPGTNGFKKFWSDVLEQPDGFHIRIKGFDNDNVDYTVKAVKYRKTTPPDRDITSSALCDALELDHCALVVDFDPASFVRSLASGTTNKEKKVYIVYNPETKNDPAGKFNLLDKTIYETNKGIDVIPIIEKWPKKHEYSDSFITNFNISVSMEDQINDRGEFIKNVSTITFNGNYGDQKYEKTVVDSKGSNSNASIKNELNHLYNKKYIQESDNKKKVDSLLAANACYQQKRSGDWFQVLSVFDILYRQFYSFDSRKTPKLADFDINEIKNVCLVTHDTIALAFGVLMGANVLFIRAGSTSSGISDSGLTTQGGADTVYLFKNASFKGENDAEFLDKLIELQKTKYTDTPELKQFIAFFYYYNTIIEALHAARKNDLERSIADLRESIPLLTTNNIDDYNTKIKNVLFNAVKYCYYMIQYPKSDTELKSFIETLKTDIESRSMDLNNFLRRKTSGKLNVYLFMNAVRNMSFLKNTHSPTSTYLKASDYNETLSFDKNKKAIETLDVYQSIFVWNLTNRISGRNIKTDDDRLCSKYNFLTYIKKLDNSIINTMTTVFNKLFEQFNQVFTTPADKTKTEYMQLKLLYENIVIILDGTIVDPSIQPPTETDVIASIDDKNLHIDKFTSECNNSGIEASDEPAKTIMDKIIDNNEFENNDGKPVDKASIKTKQNTIRTAVSETAPSVDSTRSVETVMFDAKEEIVRSIYNDRVLTRSQHAKMKKDLKEMITSMKTTKPTRIFNRSKITVTNSIPVFDEEHACCKKITRSTSSLSKINNLLTMNTVAQELVRWLLHKYPDEIQIEGQSSNLIFTHTLSGTIKKYDLTKIKNDTTSSRPVYYGIEEFIGLLDTDRENIYQKFLTETSQAGGKYGTKDMREPTSIFETTQFKEPTSIFKTTQFKEPTSVSNTKTDVQSGLYDLVLYDLVQNTANGEHPLFLLYITMFFYHQNVLNELNDNDSNNIDLQPYIVLYNIFLKLTLIISTLIKSSNIRNLIHAYILKVLIRRWLFEYNFNNKDIKMMAIIFLPRDVEMYKSVVSLLSSALNNINVHEMIDDDNNYADNDVFSKDSEISHTLMKSVGKQYFSGLDLTTSSIQSITVLKDSLKSLLRLTGKNIRDYRDPDYHPVKGGKMRISNKKTKKSSRKKSHGGAKRKTKKYLHF